MTQTRASRAAAWTHLTQTMFQDAKIQAFFAHQEIESIVAMMRLSDDDYKVGFLVDGEEQHLSAAKVNMIKDCLHWYAAQSNRTSQTWLLLTPEILEEYQEDVLFISSLNDSTTPGTSITASNTDQESVKAKEMELQILERKLEVAQAEEAAAKAKADAYEKGNNAPVKVKKFSLAEGVKKDPGNFPNLEDTSKWIVWNTKFVNIATQQGMAHILDGKFCPKEEDKASFKDENTYMYTVFVSILKTMDNKTLLAKYKDKQDGQGLYQELVRELASGDSGAGSDRADEIVSELTTTKLTNDSKAVAKAVHLFLNLITELDTLRPEDVTEHSKRTWLLAFIKEHTELNAAFESLVSHAKMIDDINRTAAEIDGSPTTITPSKPSYSLIKQSVLRKAKHLDSLDEKAKAAQRKAAAAARSQGQTTTTTPTGGRGGRGGRGQDGGQGRGRGGGRGNAGGSQAAGPAGDSMTFQQLLADPWAWCSDARWGRLSYDEQNQLRAAREAAGPRPNRNINAARGSGAGRGRGGRGGATGTVASSTVADNGVGIPGTVATFPGGVSLAPTVMTAPSVVQPPGQFMQNLMANQATRTISNASVDAPTILGADGYLYTRRMNVARRIYRVTAAEEASAVQGSLVDGGASGGLAGKDMRMHVMTNEVCDVTGIAENALKNLPIGTGMAVIGTSSGPVIGLFHQYAFHDGEASIHSVTQLRDFGLLVDDKARSQGGKQLIVTACGRIIPLAIRNGLPHLDLRPPTDEEIETLPTVIISADAPWRPDILDNEWTADELAELPERDTEHGFVDPRVNDIGELLPRSVNTASAMPSLQDEHLDNVEACVHATSQAVISHRRIFTTKVHVNGRVVNVKKPDYKQLRPYLGWIPEIRVKKTLEATTQHYRAATVENLRHSSKSRFPGANVPRVHDDFAMDMIISDTPAWDDGIPGHGGAQFAQLFVGKHTKLTKIYPMQKESETPYRVESFIRDVGAPDVLRSDNSKTQTSKLMDQLMNLYCIRRQFCEPGYQNQNYAERRIQDIQAACNSAMNRLNIPAGGWLIVALFFAGLFNVVAHESLGWKTPMEAAYNQQPDISPYLEYHLWQPVYYELSADEIAHGDGTGIGTQREGIGRWIGVAENHGDILTYLVLSERTGKTLVRSKLRAVTDDTRNLRAEAQAAPSGEAVDASEDRESTGNIDNFIQSLAGSAGLDYSEGATRVPYFSVEELLGRTVLLDEEDGSVRRYEVVKKIVERDENNHANVKYLLSVGDGTLEEIISYNELSDLVERQVNAELNGDVDGYYAYDKIDGHAGPMLQSHPEYKGSSYNVLVQWTSGEKTWEPLDIMFKDDPATVSAYAKECGLLDTDGWKRCRKYTKREKVFDRMVKAARAAAARHGDRFKFGVQIPRNWAEAKKLDAKNGNTLWTDAVRTEMQQLHDYDTFKDMGKGFRMGTDWTKIGVHLIFDCKHDLRRKARLVAGGHVTEPPKDAAYSGVVSLRSIRLIATIAELNGLEFWAADVGNAYLEATTDEKRYIIAGPEFGELEGHTLVIYKALYGLRTSGARWHAHFAATLTDMGFTQSWADSDVWMKDCGTHYEFVCVFVDDLALAMKDPQTFCDLLKSKYNYKLKGVGEISYHLGADFYRDPDGTLCMSAKTYIGRLVKNYEDMFGEKPIPRTSPMDDGDHPELDLTRELDAAGIKNYQSLIGGLQWAVSLCRYDIHVAVMTMGRFRVAPHFGHLERLKRVCGYLARFPDAAIRFRPGYPTLQAPVRADWIQTIYAGSFEEMPWNMPVPKGNGMTITTFVDANLLHDHVTGRAAMGVLHLVNKTPVEWFSKRQNTVETATYGSEFVAAKTATEQIMDLRYCLRMLGVPIIGTARMFGDNLSVVSSSTIPQSVLTKRHNALAYHRVREAIAAGILHFDHIGTTQNPADVLTKFLGYAKFAPLIKPLLFWRGED